MKNYLVFIKFDGRVFHGWQVQKNAVTVMGTFQEALEGILKESVSIHGCGRTDAGVSANEYAVSFKTNANIPPEGLIKGLNAVLPDSIAAYKAEIVDDDFHARYSLIKKEYVYRILNNPIPDPLNAGLYFRYGGKLDVRLMNRNAEDYLGTHDFSAFKNTGTEIEDCTRTIYEAKVEEDGDYVLFTVCGDGFLYNMVRIMAGTLIDISAGKIPSGSVSEILESKDRSRAGFTAPASGLILNKLYYPEGI